MTTAAPAAPIATPIATPIAGVADAPLSFESNGSEFTVTVTPRGATDCQYILQICAPGEIDVTVWVTFEATSGTISYDGYQFTAHDESGNLYQPRGMSQNAQGSLTAGSASRAQVIIGFIVPTATSALWLEWVPSISGPPLATWPLDLSLAIATPPPAKLAIVVCQSDYGYPPGPDKSFPAATAAPRGVSVSGLSLYTATNGTVKQLGPSGWACSFSAGADGSYEMTIRSPDDLHALVEYDSGVNGPGAALAAPLFPTFSKTFCSGVPGACPTPPSGIRVSHISANVVRFTVPTGVDPPGYLARADMPTQYETIGAMQAVPQQGVVSATEVLCLVDPAHASTCNSVVATAIAYWKTTP